MSNGLNGHCPVTPSSAGLNKVLSKVDVIVAVIVKSPAGWWSDWDSLSSPEA